MSGCATSSSSLTELIRRGRQTSKGKLVTVQVEDFYERMTNMLSKKKMFTGFCSDQRMKEHFCPWDENYPESPERYRSIAKRMVTLSLPGRCISIDYRLPTNWELLMIHTESHINQLKKTVNMNDTELEDLATNYDSIYFNQKTYECSLIAAGCSMSLVDAIIEGTVQNGFALVRPPGHHASAGEFNGYCLINNVALAAQFAMVKHGLERILIVDWDVHHGQGTQRMFYNDSRVLYFSIHRYEYGTFWPNLRESDFDYIGEDEGKGYNINVPLNETGCNDIDYLAIFLNVLLPVAYEFDPQLVIISAGFDSALGDEKGEMNVTPGCYHHLTTLLMGLADGKVAVILEGGYFLPSLAEGAAQTLRALLGDPAPVLEPHADIKESVKESIFNVQSQLVKYWTCFQQDITELQMNYSPKIIYKGHKNLPPFPTRQSYAVLSQVQSLLYTSEIDMLRSMYYQSNTQSVGYIYEEELELHNSKTDDEYENPSRIKRIHEIFTEYDLFDRMLRIKGREATYKDVELVHERGYLKTLQKVLEKKKAMPENWKSLFYNEHSYKCLLKACGSLLQLLDKIHDGRLTSGVAIIRPPGHHAEKDLPGGFCFVNNVAIAAEHAIRRGVKRVLIVDWDIHHGNGIQNAFYDREDVLYISLHRYDNGKFYPYSKKGDVKFTGCNDGTGYNINIPWNNEPMGDAEYIRAFTKIILPIAYEYNPDFVIVSAGFDAAVLDPLGKYHLSPEVYGHMVQLLKPLAGGKIIVVLEGGYNANSVAYSMAACTLSLVSDPFPALKLNGPIKKSAQKTIQSVIDQHSSRWEYLRILPRIYKETHEPENEQTCEDDLTSDT